METTTIAAIQAQYPRPVTFATFDQARRQDADWLMQDYYGVGGALCLAVGLQSFHWGFPAPFDVARALQILRPELADAAAMTAAVAINALSDAGDFVGAWAQAAAVVASPSGAGTEK